MASARISCSESLSKLFTAVPKKGAFIFASALPRRSQLGFVRLPNSFLRSCSLSLLTHARKHKRDIVRLLVFADPILHSGNHDFGNSVECEMPVAADQLQKTLLAKLSEFIFWLGDA